MEQGGINAWAHRHLVLTIVIVVVSLTCILPACGGCALTILGPMVNQAYEGIAGDLGPAR